MMRVFQVQHVPAHGRLVEFRRIAPDARRQFPDIVLIRFLGAGAEPAQFKQLRKADLRGIIRGGRSLGRAALLGGLCEDIASTLAANRALADAPADPMRPPRPTAPAPRRRAAAWFNNKLDAARCCCVRWQAAQSPLALAAVQPGAAGLPDHPANGRAGPRRTREWRAVRAPN